MDFLYPSARCIVGGAVHLAVHPVDTLRTPIVVTSSLLLLISGPIGTSFAAILVCSEVVHRGLSSRRVSNFIGQRNLTATAAPYARQVVGYTFIASGLLLAAAGIIPFISPICGLSLVVIGIVLVVDEHNRAQAVHRLRAAVTTAQALVDTAVRNMTRAQEEAEQLTPTLQGLGSQITELNALISQTPTVTEQQEGARAAQLQDAHIKLARQHAILLEYMRTYETVTTDIRGTLQQPINETMDPDALRHRRATLHEKAAVCESATDGIARANEQLTAECATLCETLATTLCALKSEPIADKGGPLLLAANASFEPGTSASAALDDGEYTQQLIKKERAEVRTIVREMEAMAENVRAFAGKLPAIQENVRQSASLHTQVKQLFRRCCIQ